MEPQELMETKGRFPLLDEFGTEAECEILIDEQSDEVDVGDQRTIRAPLANKIEKNPDCGDGYESPYCASRLSHNLS